MPSCSQGDSVTGKGAAAGQRIMACGSAGRLGITVEVREHDFVGE